MSRPFARLPTHSRQHRWGAMVAPVAALLLVSACGASGSPTSAAAAAKPSPAASGQTRGVPRITGEIAAVAGNTLHVQSTSTQTAVTYGPTTTITDTAAATATDLTTGLCASARPATRDAAAASALTAATVVLSSPINGECGTSGAGRLRGPTASSTVPRRFPHPARNNGDATGPIASVNGSTFIVRQTQPGPRTSLASTDITVTTTPNTSFAKTTPANASVLVDGSCLAVVGKPNNVGVVAAKSLTVRPPRNGSCDPQTGANARTPGA